VTYPLLVAGISVLAWKVVGVTLQPVEDLRSGADRIAHSGQSQRLAVPDGNDEIHKLAVTLNEMLGRQEAAHTRQRAFVADAAHELRSPLANLRVQLEVAQHHGQPLTTEDLLIDVHRLGRLVDDLLLLARADAEQPALDTCEVELSELLHEVADSYRTAQVPVRVAPALHGPQTVTADPEALRRVLANLADNAVRHARSKVTVAVTRDRDHVIATVTDDGPGIAAEDRERVFGRFTRLDDARARDAGGSGLGLAIVRELIGKHHGTVHLEDAGPGVRAVIRLPRTEDGAHQ
jgi:signal transduction histidine kinase